MKHLFAILLAVLCFPLSGAAQLTANFTTNRSFTAYYTQGFDTESDFNTWTVKSYNWNSTWEIADQISYSTINVYIDEVRETTEPVALPKTLGERISQQFRNTINGLVDFGENFIVWLVGASPVLLILAVIAVIVLLIVKRGAAKRAVRREEKARKNAEAIAQWRETHTETPIVSKTMQKEEPNEQKKQD